MKTFVLIIFSFLILIGCNNDKTDQHKNRKLELDNSGLISQRHLHEKKFEGFDFKTEHEWDSLNSISLEKVAFKKAKLRTDIRTFGWHIYSNGSFCDFLGVFWREPGSERLARAGWRSYECHHSVLHCNDLCLSEVYPSME